MAVGSFPLNLPDSIWQFETSHDTLLKDPCWVVLCGHFQSHLDPFVPIRAQDVLCPVSIIHVVVLNLSVNAPAVVLKVSLPCHHFLAPDGFLNWAVDSK